MNESENLEPQTTAENPNFDSEYLREAVRLAELRMTEYARIYNEYERRAVLLITFCVALIGYLLSGEWAEWTAAVKFLAIFCLMSAAWKGLRIFSFSEFGVQGIHPNTVANPIFGGRADVLLEYVRGEYAERIDQNAKNLHSRSRFLDSAKRWFYAGLTTTAAIVLAEKLRIMIS